MGSTSSWPEWRNKAIARYGLQLMHATVLTYQANQLCESTVGTTWLQFVIRRRKIESAATAANLSCRYLNRD